MSHLSLFAAWFVSSDAFAAVAVIAFFLGVMTLVFWSNWKKYNPRGFSFFCGMFVCMGLAAFAAIHSTVPSSASRKTVTGLVTWILTTKQGKSSETNFGLLPASRQGIALKASAIIPQSAQSQMVEVTYLDEHGSDNPRAISVRILSGPRIGWSDSVNANWLGTWLGVPAAIAGFACLLFANRNVRPTKVQAEQNEDL